MHGDWENDRGVGAVDCLDGDRSCRCNLAHRTGRRVAELNWYIRCIFSWCAGRSRKRVQYISLLLIYRNTEATKAYCLMPMLNV